ncbi:MAG: HAD-IC family P-type ATPase, partial [Gemmatimonadaceae bacterium]
GVPAVTDVVTFDASSERTLLQLAVAVDRHSEHPLARAIVEYAQVRHVDSSPSNDFEALPGRGARARVDGHLVAVGNLRLARDLGVRHAEAINVLQRFEQEGKTAVLVIRDDHALGAIAMADQLRSDSRCVMQSLAAMGVRRAVMLTGDNTGTAAAVAEQLALTDYRAELLPDDKVRAIRELQASGETVAFVGDGVNDAPALAIADVGIAMGAAGTDVALETADIALMADDLSKLPMAIRIARRTLAIVRQNIWFAIGVKVLFLILAVSGWATLWMAVAADMGASLLVVANGLRARRVR